MVKYKLVYSTNKEKEERIKNRKKIEKKLKRHNIVEYVNKEDDGNFYKVL